MSWRVLAWSRELGRGKLVHEEYGVRDFDAGLAMVDDFALQEEVEVTFQDGASPQRILQINPVGGRRNASEMLSLQLEPAGIFLLTDGGTTTPDEILSAWQGKPFCLSARPPLLLLEGYNQAAPHEPAWLQVEEELNTFLDERLGVQATVNRITGDSHDVGEALDRLAEGGSGVIGYRRIFRMEAHVAFDWTAMSAEDRKRLTDAVPHLPGWKRIHDSGLWWFGEAEGLAPYLKGTKDAQGMHFTGLLPLTEWRSWRNAFTVAIRGLPLKKQPRVIP